MLRHICCGKQSPATPTSESSFGQASTVEQVYRSYDDYFESIPMQTLPQPLPPLNRRTPRPPPIVLPESIYGIVNRTYVPVTQKLPPLADAPSYDEAIEMRVLKRMDELRAQALQRHAVPPKAKVAPPKPPPRSASLPCPAPARPNVPRGVPMPPPRVPNFARPLPVPPPLAQPPRPLPPSLNLPLQNRFLLSPEDANYLHVRAPALKPLRLPQLVAQRQSPRQPLQRLGRLPAAPPPVPRLPSPSDLAYLQAGSPSPSGRSASPQPLPPGTPRPKASYFD